MRYASRYSGRRNRISRSRRPAGEFCRIEVSERLDLLHLNVQAVPLSAAFG